MLVFVIATKYFFEAGSAESRKPVSHFQLRAARFLLEHSLTLVLMLTGAGWIVLDAKSDVDSRAGQVVGNIVSAWSDRSSAWCS